MQEVFDIKEEEKMATKKKKHCRTVPFLVRDLQDALRRPGRNRERIRDLVSEIRTLHPDLDLRKILDDLMSEVRSGRPVESFAARIRTDYLESRCPTVPKLVTALSAELAKPCPRINCLKCLIGKIRVLKPDTDLKAFLGDLEKDLEAEMEREDFLAFHDRLEKDYIC